MCNVSTKFFQSFEITGQIVLKLVLDAALTVQLCMPENDPSPSPNMAIDNHL